MLLENSCFLFTILLKKLQNKKVHKEYALAGPCICNHKLELALAIKTTFLPHLHLFFLLPFCFYCGWMVLNCGCMLFKSINKANLCKIRTRSFLKTAVFFLQSFWKIAKNRSTKGTPLQVLAFANINWNWHLQFKTAFLPRLYFCSCFLFVLNCGWIVSSLWVHAFQKH